MIKFSTFTWIMIAVFLLATLSVMLCEAVPAMVYVALVLLSAGFVMLTISLYLKNSKKAKEDERIKEELLMELSVTDEGEEYVLKNNPTTKKYKRMLRKEHFNRFLPVIFTGLVALIMIFLLIKAIFKF